MKKHLNNIEEYICFIVSCVLLILTFANVFSRFIIHASISYTDEITTNLFVLLSTVGTALAVKRGAHLGLNIVTDLLPKKTASAVAVAASIIGFSVAAVIFYCGCTMVGNQIKNGAVSTTLMIPSAIYGSFLPIGMLLTMLRFLEQAFRHLKNIKSDDDGGDIPHVPIA